MRRPFVLANSTQPLMRTTGSRSGVHMTVRSSSLLSQNPAIITEPSTRHGDGAVRRPLTPGSPVGPLRHPPILIHLPLNTLTPKHNPAPTHTTTNDRNQVRSSTQVRDLPEGADKGIRWRTTIELWACRAFGEPYRCLG